MNLKGIVSASNLQKVAGLGIGTMAARVVATKIKGIDALSGKNYSNYAANGVPVLLGMYLSSMTSPLVGAIGNGMIGNAIANIVGPLIDKDNKIGLYGDVLLSGYDTMLQGVEEQGGNSSYDTYGFTPNGEMDY
jgi:hypothetical protein